MRKFTKVCVIASLICLLTGGVLTGISVAMGGTSFVVEWMSHEKQ